MYQVICKPNIFDRDSTVYAEVKQGLTLAQVLGDGISHAASVTIDGFDVPRELWARVRPKAGKQIHVMLYPQGGNAGKWIKIIAVVVISYFTFGAGAPAAAAWLGVSTTTLSIIGAVAILAVNALIPPPTPKGLDGQSGDPFQRLNSITGTSNQATPYGVIPCVVGRMRYFPPHAALPYTEISGADQYLRMLLDLGYGDLDISDIQIGGTALSSFEDVDYEISTTPGLFTQDMYELAVGVDMSDNGAAATRTTQDASNEISLDLVFSNGLFGMDTQGKTTTGTANFDIEYAPAGSDTWTSVTAAAGLTSTNGLVASAGNFTVSSKARKTLRCGVRWNVAAGQYDVKVTRIGSSFPGSAGASAQSGACAWSVLRSVAYHNPSTTGTTKLALRIKATGQLNGVIQNLSVLSAQKMPMWNKSTGVWLAAAETDNPAWLYAWLLTRCPAVIRRLADARLDLDGIADWADECAAKGYKCSFVLDSPRAFADVLKDVLASGRATFGFRNGLYSAIRDVEQTVPVQMFTPANSWGFSYSRAFADLPHALRCKFVNPEANYQQDYVTVYAAGYNADGSDGLTAATRFEELDLGPVVDPGAAWRLGMYHMSVIWNRPTQYVFNADIEHMVCERGDLITVAHDVTAWGEAWGRVVAVDAATQVVTLDGPVTLEAGKTYQLRARSVGSTSPVQNIATVTNAAGEYTVLTLDAAIGAAVGDLWMLGMVNQGVASLIVRQIEPDADMNAKLTCVDAAPAVWSADSGTPPTFVSAITGTAWCAAPDAPEVNIRSGDSAPDDAGVIHAQPAVSTAPSSGIRRIPLWKMPNPERGERQYAQGMW